jgi:hypothetical protein
MTMTEEPERQLTMPTLATKDARVFPIEPLFAFIGREGDVFQRPGGTRSEDGNRSLGPHAALAMRLGTTPLWVYRAAPRGLNAFAADVSAVILGVHPVEIWPDWFDHAPSDKEVADAEVREKDRNRKRCRIAGRDCGFTDGPSPYRAVL